MPTSVISGYGTNGAALTGWTLNLSSQLMQDYLLTADILLQGDSAAPIATFVNAGGGTDLLVIDSTGTLQHLFLDPTSSSGWNMQSAGLSFTVSAVVAGNDSDGSIHAFVMSTSGNELYQVIPGGETNWVATDMQVQASNMMLTTVPASSSSAAQLVLYGTTTQGQLYFAAAYSTNIFTSSAPEYLFWGIQQVALPSATPGAELALVSFQSPVNSTPSWTLLGGTESTIWSYQIPLPLEQYGTYPSVTLTNAPGGMNRTAPVSNSGLPLVSAMGVDSSTASLYTVESTANGTSLAFNSIESLSSVVPNLAADTVCVTFENFQSTPGTTLQAYLLDTTGALWVVRSETEGSYATPFPLGGSLQAIYTPQGTNINGQVFAIDSGSALCMLQQDPVTTMWSIQRIQQPSAEAVDLTTYATKGLLADGNGVPVASVPVTITASSAATIWVQGTATQIGPTQPATVSTDAAGRLTIVSPAFGLGTPSLTFSASGLAASVTENPAADVQNYLSGTGSLNALPTFDASTIGTLAPGLSPTGATDAVQGIQSALQMGNSASASAANRVGAGGGWKIEFNTNSTRDPVFTRLNEPELAQLHSQAADSLSSLWGDLKKFAGDVWHAIRAGAAAVSSIVADVAKGFLTLTLKIAGEIDQAVDMVINGIEDAVNAVHSIFISIGVAVEDVINFVRSLFDWEDINNTRQVLEYLLNQTGPCLNTMLKQFGTVTEGFFSGLKTKLSDAASALSGNSMFQNQTISSLGTSAFNPSQSSAGNARAAAPPSGSPSAFTSSPTCHWVVDKMVASGGNSSGLAFTPVSELGTLWTTFTNDFQSVETDLKSALQNIQVLFTGEATPSGQTGNPSNTKNIGITAVIDLLQDLLDAVLDFADAVIQTFLQMVELVTSALASYLAQPLTDIPLLSNLYQQECGEPMTVAGLIALAAAVPLTVGYKILNATTNPPFTADFIAYLTSLDLSNFSTDSSSAQAQTAANATPAQDTSGWAIAWSFLATGNQAIWTLIDTLLDMFGAMGVPPPPRWVGLLDIGGLCFGQYFSWPAPNGIPAIPVPLSNAADITNFVTWLSRFPVLILDTALLFLPQSESGILRYQDPAGQITQSCLGVLTLALSVAAVGCGLANKPPTMNGWEAAAALLSPFPSIGQVLRLKSLNVEDVCLGQLTQVVNDAACGVSAAILMFFDSIEMVIS
jgi:hypothetical protein